MPNVVKYSTTAENNAIKKGNIAIGVNSVDYGGGGGQSGWWNTIDVPNGGYVVYVNKASNGPSIMVPPNDTTLVGVARSFGASASVTTAAGALNYFASQSDMMVLNNNYQNIVTSGLVLNLDASFVASYPLSGTTWYDFGSQTNNGTLQNGPTFNSIGYLTNDGVDDNILVTANSSIKFNQNSNFTMEILIKMPSTTTYQNDTNNAYGWLTTDSNLFNRGDTNGRYGMDLNTPSLDSNLGCYDSLIDNISGDLWVVGYFQVYQSTNTFNIVKINTDGSLDTSFVGTNGIVRTIAQDSSGKIYIGGDFTTYSGTSINRIAKLNNDGTLDTSFTVGTGFNNSVYEIKIDASNNVFVGGDFTTYSGATRNRMVKLLSGGTIDTTFSIGTGFNGIVRSIEIDNNGKILVGGNFTTYTGSTNNYFIRLNTDGGKDTAMNISTGFNNAVYTITKDSSNKYYLGGTFTTYTGTSYNRIIGLNDNGTVNTNFGIGTGFNSTIESIVVDSSNNLYVGGWFSTYSGNSNVGIIKLLSTGFKDTSFTGTGLFNVGNTDVTSTLYTNRFTSLKIDSNGKIYGIGKFNRYISTVYRKVLRLNTNGSVDTVFNPGNGIRALMNFGTTGSYYLNLRYGCRGTGNTSGSFITNTLFTKLDRWYHFVSSQQTGSTFNTGQTYTNAVVGTVATIPNSGNTDSTSAYYMARSTSGNIIGGNGSGTITSESVQIARLYNRVLSIDEIRQNYYQAPIVTTNLSQMWDAGNIVSYESGTTYTYDLVTDSVTGTTENGVLFSRGYGGFWTFDGTNDRILLGSSITMGNGSTGWTISAWVKTTTNVTGLGNGTIISNQSGGPVYSQLCINGGKITYWRYKTSWEQFTGNTIVNTGTWVNLVWRNNVSNTMTFFVNGVADGIVSDSTIGGPTTNPLDSIGRYTTSNSFAGDIALIMIHRAALTQNEIIQNFNAHRNRFGL